MRGIKEKYEKLLRELDLIIAQMKMLGEIYAHTYPEIEEITEEFERMYLKFKLFLRNIREDKKNERCGNKICVN
ncbi:MAG: hypothetical protein J7K73_01555 [Nanoarchaeota archaeon]|nr:hypothetical protein [Nanoarchaeota archaeon]